MKLPGLPRFSRAEILFSAKSFAAAMLANESPSVRAALDEYRRNQTAAVLAKPAPRAVPAGPVRRGRRLWS